MRNQKNARRMVPVTFGRVTSQADASSIPRSDRKTHHGDFNGTQVNSPQSCLFGDSIIIWPEEGKDVAFSMSKAAFGVAARDFLRSEGITNLNDESSLAA